MTAVAGYPDSLAHLADELRRLDLTIRRRLATATLLNDLAPQGQTARTVYITRDEVEWLLDTGGPPGTSAPELDEVLDQVSAVIAARVRAATTPLALPRLGRLFGLSAVELRAVVICLAPELRRKYDRLYAYLQDDITRKRPSVDLVLELLHDDEGQRWRGLRSFDDGARLLRLGILRVVPDPASPSGSSALGRFLALDPRICRYLLGDDEDELDARLAGIASLDRAGRPVGGRQPDPAGGLARLAARHDITADMPGPALVLALHGPPGSGRQDLARQVSAHLGLALLTVDASTPATTPDLITIAVREARLRHAAVCLTGPDAAPDDGRPLLAALAGALHDLGGLAVVTTIEPWRDTALPGIPVHEVTLALPDVPRSIALWRDALSTRTPESRTWAGELAERFRFGPGAIRAAAAEADRRRLTEAEPRALTLSDVYAACRDRSAGRLADLAVAVHPACGWDDLVLPEPQLRMLRDICAQARHRQRVYGGWGFGTLGGRGTGVTALFGGPPGTGKTMAAEVCAADLGLDLYRVDLSGVVSKYVGETEKNLRRVFAEARGGNAILFFDEADALFGKRTEVSDAHDRYANIETSYLLQQMEQYDGVVLLATNLRQNLDDAFTRRLRSVVEFPFPDAGSRARIWRTHLPATAPVAADVDPEALGREFEVAGGTIRNIVLNAAFLAAGDGQVIDRRHILDGTRREFEKIGRLWIEPAR
ncbi:ATP-binding protein [Actinoplanes sp. NPDC051475]|uniref:ATP-binding protein n=1 Tax=Actinoplanes sp. NPDC051475 TaxID=3157225 RepID=UPI00344D2027